MITGAKALFTFDAHSTNPDDLAWSLIVFAYSTDRAQDEWINGYGTSVRFSEVVEFGLATLEKATAQLQAAMRKGQLADEPDGIHAFTCGGLHLTYGLYTCLRLGHTPTEMAHRMKIQYDILVWRLKSDSRFIDHYYSAFGSDYPADVTRMYYLDAKLKFLGHAFEVINHARHSGVFVPSSAQEDAVGAAQKELLDVVEAIGSDGPKKVRGDAELFKLLIGDACHAYRALSLIGEA